MKTRDELIAKHIRRLNELLGVDGNRYDKENSTITIALLKALAKAEGAIPRKFVYTTNAVDKAAEDMKDQEW